ncbi:hypothetical protein [Chitinophaga filiformis]|uniref:Uncharacterized protein n=1 Tax=Chitinophaga filiformis TaxID=104663 RepID=A0ABY4IAD7_CHIFI|nr:hypothetical protein [Chitinophaga filiformis]UPK72850.1 hypothetical protein MYF79_16285 [Chitinophaga filiformis]
MKQELKDALNNWKNTTILGINNKFVRIKNLPKGEYLIELTMREKISFQEETANVSETASLITYTQSGESGEFGDLMGDSYPNPNGDIFRFNAISINLETKYWTKRENELSRLIQSVMPDGFLDM